MDHDTINCRTEKCPCGRGKVIIDIVTSENDWTIKSDWVGRIDCEICGDRFHFIQFGRGVALITSEDAKRRTNLLGAAAAGVSKFITSAEVSEILDQIATQLSACPTMAATYRLAVALGLESATVQTFRKHMRDTPMRRWVGYQFSSYGRRPNEQLAALAPLYRHLGRDTSSLEKCIDQVTGHLREAAEPPKIIASFGPINLLAAISKSRETATN